MLDTTFNRVSTQQFVDQRFQVLFGNIRQQKVIILLIWESHNLQKVP